MNKYASIYIGSFNKVAAEIGAAEDQAAAFNNVDKLNLLGDLSGEYDKINFNKPIGMKVPLPVLNPDKASVAKVFPNLSKRFQAKTVGSAISHGSSYDPRNIANAVSGSVFPGSESAGNGTSPADGVLAGTLNPTLKLNK